MNRTRFASALAMAALVAFLLPSFLHAQITFERTYGGPADEMGESVMQTGDGGYIVAGSTYSFGAGKTDVFLLKLNASGGTLWMRTYGGPAEDHGYCVQQTSDGGYIATGGTGSFGVGGDIYVIKTNAGGDTQWTRTYGGSQDDCGFAVRQTPDSGYVIAGWTESFGAGDYDVYLVKTDVHGDTLWTKTFGGSRWECAYSVQQTSDGGYIFAGGTGSFGAGAADAYVVKTDAKDDTQWTKTFGGLPDDVGRSVQQTADSGYVIAGWTNHVAYLLKTDANGDTAWTRTYGGGLTSNLFSVQQASDGGYVAAGRVSHPGAGGGDAYLVRTDAYGDARWTKSFGGDSLEYGFSGDCADDGGFVLAGFTKSYGAGGEDIYVIKTDSLGNVASMTEPKGNSAYVLALSFACEPNPFRTRTAISLQPAANSTAGLAVFDASGRCVRTFTVNRASYTVWDGRNDAGQALPSGAYFIRCDAAGEHATARVVLQR